MTEFVIGSLSYLPFVAATSAEDMTLVEKMQDAGINTLLGMGMAFAVLILISAIISLFPLLGKSGKSSTAAGPAPKQSAPQTASASETLEEEEELSDDEELVAVIAAAIAAYEGSGSTEGFQVRSIRRRSIRNR